jgi:nitrogenase molybdenum-iron protein beta chain
MAQLVEQIRHVCALGAFQSVLAIERAVPILHAGPGCGQKAWGAMGTGNGCQGSGYVGGHSIPCTNVSEKEIIFGGEEKLRQLIGNALEVIDGDLFVVLTGCTSDIVGDDVGDVARSFQSLGKPVVYAETGGFKGTNYYGHELVLQAIIEQYLQPADKIEPGLVNIWSVVPYQDAFWTGNLRGLERLLKEIGLRPNLIFGPGRGIAAVDKVSGAQFNLLISPWVGLRNMRQLEERFGTPYLHYPALPIGPTETGRLLRTVGDYAGVDPQLVEQVIDAHEAEFFYYIERSADVIIETRLMPRRFVTISDSFYALGIARFLINDMGLLPETQYITDGTPPEFQAEIRRQFSLFVDGITARVDFTTDVGAVHERLRQEKFLGRPLLIGSAWERVLSTAVNGYQFSVSLPVSDRMVLDRSYVGYDGALRLVEDIYSLVLDDFQ